MLADDEPAVRQSIKLLLEHDGHEVLPVNSGEAALEQLSQRKFDLVITDFLMPGMHGDELVAGIRKLIPTQPVILATSFADEFKKYGERSARVDVLLLKPFSLEDLRAAIEQVLAKEQPDQANDNPPAT